MPDIGMVDLVGPIQAGAAIAAQANNQRRQREEMALRFQEAQARQAEMQALAQERIQRAAKEQNEITTQQNEIAQTKIFQDSVNKDMADITRENPSLPLTQVYQKAFQQNYGKVPAKHAVELFKAGLTAAGTEEKNQAAMERGIAALEQRAQSAADRAKFWEETAKTRQQQAETAELRRQDNEAFRAAQLEAQKNAKIAAQDAANSKLNLEALKGLTDAGEKAFANTLKDPKTTIQDAQTAKLRAQRVFGEQWTKVHPPQRVVQPDPTSPIVQPVPTAGPDNADAESSPTPTDQPTLAPSAANKIFDFDKKKGVMVPAQ